MAGVVVQAEAAVVGDAAASMVGGAWTVVATTSGVAVDDDSS